ncbi:hypothetical protein SPRG_04929 [Saprolegnia parasitica CBS 223.65]|uniref:Amino acid transporter transmembrane domain-containing protein n=1 Tax=Saprolegnia parasitica (strain CBS 223.65) TaxID=695850 RepID=A0A067CKV5_SAPPC|nr:hypothetical protein SPRG_04929 [Saprolegnia parasitica CBS 223.65]KDO29830.1 hypothetical protein SPRG_04929 [Saprolegnia parasitica CBS 223.65]|eukprot:XP_012199457.1 hypothetical protein SPRG_04929 [Saprolegnia parasitica CBS 223.65]
MAFLTLEDMKIVVSLVCCCLGVGSLGLAGNYARAGYVAATIAFILMAIINTYATWCLCKVLVVAPKSILTLGDLGDWCFGRVGKYFSLIFQCLLCAMYPIVYLVLGGTLLSTLFPMSFSQTTWLILMAITLLPVCLVPTMKEGAGMALAGGLATVLADGIALALLITNMEDVNPAGISPPSPEITFTSVTTVFGNLAFAYASAHAPHLACRARHHHVFFFAVALLGVFSAGCQTPNNLLFAISGSKLGFAASRGYVVLAFLCMQFHITIAFAVIFFPVFQILERLVLGLHKDRDMVVVLEKDVETPALDDDVESATFHAVVEGGPREEVKAYRAPGSYFKASLVRTALIAVCVVIAVIWKNHLNALVDFVGASASALVNMILPMVFYLKTFWPSIKWPEKIFAFVCILIAVFLGVYVSIQTGKDLFSPETADPTILFPLCPAAFQQVVFTNTTYYHY